MIQKRDFPTESIGEYANDLRGRVIIPIGAMSSV